MPDRSVRKHHIKRTALPGAAFLIGLTLSYQPARRYLFRDQSVERRAEQVIRFLDRFHSLYNRYPKQTDSYWLPPHLSRVLQYKASETGADYRLRYRYGLGGSVIYTPEKNTWTVH